MNNAAIIAVIDIGSNSIRLQVAKVLDRTYKIIEEYKETVRIGDNVFRTGEFSPEAISTITRILSRMKVMMDNSKVSKYRAVATASFREATNATEAVTQIQNDTGIQIEIISGIEEARIMSLAAAYSFQLSDVNALIVDMGGGSTEFSLYSHGELIKSETTMLGASKLTYEFFKSDPVQMKELKAIKQEINKTLDSILPKSGVDMIICSGGTLNNISFVYNKRNNMSDSSVKFVDSIFLKHFTSELLGKKVAERLKISGVEPARADMIFSAAVLASQLVRRYKTNGFYTLSGGLRSGLTIDVMNKMGVEMFFQQERNSDVRYSRLLELGKKYYFEESHALQVCRLSERIFHQLKEELALEDSHWLLLEAAALLHDVGQYISYSKHHKHSYYLLINSELTGYNDRERMMIANIARYHRRNCPKSSHIEYMMLSNEERGLVTNLSAILRVADGLDRAHAGFVKDVAVTVEKDEIIFEIFADDDAGMEKQGFDKKKDLLESITNKSAVVK